MPTRQSTWKWQIWLSQSSYIRTGIKSPVSLPLHITSESKPSEQNYCPMPTYTNYTVPPVRSCKLATLTPTKTNVIELIICLVKAFT